MTAVVDPSDMTRWATWREIHAQPDIWAAWGAQVDIADLRAWVDAQSVNEVWFCGAGTSAYIGDIIAAAWPTGAGTGTGPRLRSVPSTDLVADPTAWLPPKGPRPLVVSFGRSGNSAESLGTLDALDARAPEAPRLHITCNPDGALARRPSTGPLRVVSLPEATHDAGFAMTSSFSTMLLTALAIFGPPCDFAGHM
ncbi:MAG: SIS domain-containing protein, partial [Primorskyibacter sp.]